MTGTTSVRTTEQPRPRAATRLVRVSAPDDPLERAADRTAAQIMAMPDPGPSLAVGPDGDEDAVLRQADGQGDDREEEPYPFPSEPIGIGAAPVEDDGELMARRTEDAAAVAAAAAPTRVPPRSGGASLPAPVRAWMEPRFGADFADVRIHTDAVAQRAARQLCASAFTVGSHIWFAPGQWSPETTAGRRLVAHELAHVLQSCSSGRTAVHRSIATAFANYRDTCDCGEHLGNNCAHYLSDAFIRSGYADDLDGGSGARYRRRKGFIVCKEGRPVRAKEFRDWFAGQSSDTQEGEPSGSGHWAVYQERRRDGQGHVNIHAHTDSSYTWRGTTDLPTWHTQSHYSW